MTVGIFIFDDVEVLDFAGPFEVFSRTRLVPGVVSRRSDDSAPFRVVTIARTTKPITAIDGLQVTASHSWSNAPAIDILVVPGGFGVRALLDDDATLEWLRRQAAHARHTTSVCTGALLLAKAGLLRGQRATTHHAALGELASLDPTLQVRRDARVVHDTVLSSAGVAAGIDMAFAVVEKLCGRDVARETAEYIEYPWPIEPAGAPPDLDSLLQRTARIASTFLSGIGERPAFPTATYQSLRAQLDVPLQDQPLDATDVTEQLAAVADAGLVASPGPRYFGFVVGGSLPAAITADWLTSVWDQNAGLHVLSPAAAAIEQTAAAWLLDLLRLPSSASVGFVTGATMANVTGLAAARHEVLRRVGWDVEVDGLQGAPRVTLIAGASAHASIRSASRMLGLGTAAIRGVDADSQGRMRLDALEDALSAVTGPAIVCAQAGEVNTGAFDPLRGIHAIAAARGAWLHIDGAFGLWAAASPSLRGLIDGVELADSWTVDAHKWLNVPYDSGIVIVAHPAAHRAAMSQTAAYLLRAEHEERDGMDWTPEASRRARGIPIYAALRALGRQGLTSLLDRCCACARLIAERLGREPGVEILNEVVLNQVLVRFRDDSGRNITPAVIQVVQRERVCWVGGTEWQGEPAMRFSVSNWRTDSEDAERAAQSISRALREVGAQYMH